MNTANCPKFNPGLPIHYWKTCLGLLGKARRSGLGSAKILAQRIDAQQLSLGGLIKPQVPAVTGRTIGELAGELVD